MSGRISTAPELWKKARGSGHRRSRGGLTTKIHAICDAPGNPVEIDVTPGQDADINQAEPMLDNINPDAFLADRAYDADRLIDRLTERGITPVIPPKRNRTTQRETDFALYGERNLVERFFNKLKSTFLAAVQFASIIILLN
ncbi:IS5 family transposase [Acetobacter senegalensis]|nr:IS5 family transposase [Acetobacter senegalensis]